MSVYVGLPCNLNLQAGGGPFPLPPANNLSKSYPMSCVRAKVLVFCGLSLPSPVRSEVPNLFRAATHRKNPPPTPTPPPKHPVTPTLISCYFSVTHLEGGWVLTHCWVAIHRLVTLGALPTVVVVGRHATDGLFLDRGTQPPTVVCKTEAQSESAVHTLHTHVFARLAPSCMLSRCNQIY